MADDHAHGELHFLATEVPADALAGLREMHPALAECLDATRRWPELDETQRKEVPALQDAAERDAPWGIGFHAEGDRCATCRDATRALFIDRYAEGALPHATFVAGLPIHPTRACLDGFTKDRDLSQRGIDRARRETMRDFERPSPRLVAFFRHDVLKHPPFALEDWGDSVVAANPKGLDKGAMRDIERLARWVHQRLFH